MLTLPQFVPISFLLLFGNTTSLIWLYSLDLSLDDLLARISWSNNYALFNGHQPRLLIAFLILSTVPKLCFQTMFTIGIKSVSTIPSSYNPSASFFSSKSCLAWVLAKLKETFYSLHLPKDDMIEIVYQYSSSDGYR